MWKRAYEISPTGEFFIYFLIFYVFLLLKRYFFIHQSASTFLNVILHIGISIMQWCIAVADHTFHKAPFSRRKLVSDGYSFYPVFNSSYIAFQMFVGICTSVLKMFKKSLKNVTTYFNHVGFCNLLFPVFTCWFYVVMLNSTKDQKMQTDPYRPS